MGLSMVKHKAENFEPCCPCVLLTFQCNRGSYDASGERSEPPHGRAAKPPGRGMAFYCFNTLSFLTAVRTKPDISRLYVSCRTHSSHIRSLHQPQLSPRLTVHCLYARQDDRKVQQANTVLGRQQDNKLKRPSISDLYHDRFSRK